MTVDNREKQHKTNYNQRDNRRVRDQKFMVYREVSEFSLNPNQIN
jgi:hypothetical protein